MPLALIPARSSAGLLSLARAGSTSIEARRPSLRPALQVQRRVLPIVIELADLLSEQRLPRLPLPTRYLTAKLSSGVPVFVAEPIPRPIPLFVPYVIRIANELTTGGTGPAAERIALAVEDGQVHAVALLAASSTRNLESVRAVAVRHDFVPDLVWLVAELATCPFEHALQQLVVGRPRNEAIEHCS